MYGRKYIMKTKEMHNESNGHVRRSQAGSAIEFY